MGKKLQPTRRSRLPEEGRRTKVEFPRPVSRFAEPFPLLAAPHLYRDNEIEKVIRERARVDFWSKGILKPLLLPGGLLLLLGLVVAESGWFHISPSAASSYFYVAAAGGILLAWRFHSSRLLFALLTILLASRAVEFFSSGRVGASGAGTIAFEAAAFLLPLNFLLISQSTEQGFTFPRATGGLVILFIESVFVAVICRPGVVAGPAFLHLSIFGHPARNHFSFPQPAMVLFAAAFAVLLIRFLLYRKSVDNGLFWSLFSVCLGLNAGGAGKEARLYFATASLILVAAIVENSYFLAYHDELTLLPGRRAFNEALAGLQDPYAIAAVDIDHFKSFNDNYGHETGDEVLRMVAARLAEVSGGGRAYRTGGEEFTIIFGGKMVKETVPHLDLLRQTIEDLAAFSVRSRWRTPQRVAGP